MPAMPAALSDTDFLIIGAGVAGLRAAIELAAAGRVLVLAKREATKMKSVCICRTHLLPGTGYAIQRLPKSLWKRLRNVSRS